MSVTLHITVVNKVEAVYLLFIQFNDTHHFECIIVKYNMSLRLIIIGSYLVLANSAGYINIYKLVRERCVNNSI